MDFLNVIYAFSRILYKNEKFKSYTCYNMSELENIVLRKKKPVTKDHV